MLGVAVIVVGIVVAIVLGVLATGAVAYLVADPALFLGAGLVVAVGVCFLLSRWGFGLSGVRRATSSAAGLAAAVGVAIVALAAMTILDPFPVQPKADAPKDVQYWELPTGSRIAYVHAAAATGPGAEAAGDLRPRRPGDPG
ncbi:hypothetical protein [Nocardia tengchongensis]|uniref:hypothetical protein n=1 Tax=Nocardia tengchongensis TaxID=2055889 RepID=UPI003606AB9A